MLYADAGTGLPMEKLQCACLAMLTAGAVQTLLNLAHNGCLATAPLLVALPAVPLYLWWRQVGMTGEGYTAID